MKTVPFCRVTCDGNELSYVREVLESGWLTTATKAQTLETRFAESVDASYACAVNSATAALHLACEALGIRAGDRVFVPTMTFTASAEVLRYVGANPVLLDVEYGTCLLTPAILEEAIRANPGVRALVLVHYGGQAAEMGREDGEAPGRADRSSEGILAICRRHGIRLIEDAAHAFPTRYRGRMIGSFGDATCFSFYANKTITTGEGGMLVTNDEEIHRRARVMRLHGIDRDIWQRFRTPGADWEYDVVAPGFKYNMPDVNAAIGLAQLERAEALRLGRQHCAEYYLKRLAGLRGLDLPVCRRAPEEHAWHLFPIVLTPDAALLRNAFIARLAAEGIGTSVHYKPLHRMTYYRETYGLRPEDFPAAERIWRGTVSLPIFPSMTDDELAYVCDAIERALGS